MTSMKNNNTYGPIFSENKRMKEGTGYASDALPVLIGILICLTFSCCCIEIESGEGTSPSLPNPFAPAATTSPPVPAPDLPGAPIYPPAPVVTPANEPATTGTAVYAEPIPPKLAVNLSYRHVSPSADFFPRPFDYPTAPFFSGTYSLEWNNIGILAQPSNPPFVIEMEFVAATKNPYDARAIVTVRNNQTGEVIAEEGYNGEFSSENEKRICIRETGDYHINLYGYRTTVCLVLREGVEEGRAIPYGIFQKPAQTRVTPYPFEGHEEGEFW